MGTARMDRRTFLRGALAAGLLGGAGPARAMGSFSARNARILIGDGSEVLGGIRVDDGKIVALGAEVAAGGEDLQGATLWPGFWSAGTSVGLFEVDLEEATHDEVEGSDAVLPQAKVVDAYNPRSALLPVARCGGNLGNLVMPGGGALVTGQAAWLRTSGKTVEEALVLDAAGVCLNLGHGGTSGSGPKGRMGVALKLRDLFEANQPPAEAEKKRRKKEEEAKPETGLKGALYALLRRETKALISAERASDIMVALELIAAYKLDGVILGATEGHLVAKEIAAAEVPVLIGATTTQPDGYDTLGARYDNAALLHAAGVKLAFRGVGHHNLRDLPTQAGIAVAYGLPWKTAIAALCGNGPSLWKLPVGRLEVGNDADFVVSDGDPLQVRTRVLRTFSRGMEMPVVSRQTVLRERYGVLR